MNPTKPIARRHRAILSGLLVTTLAAPTSFGALTTFSENFEGLNPADGSALGNAGWKVFANVFSPGGGYLYGYGTFPAPNGTPGFSSISTGQGGPAQGAQGLVVYSDYNNADHGIGNLIEANVFQEQANIALGDVGLWRFTFDAKLGDLASPTTALAFIKTLDPNNGFATTNFLSLDTTSLPTTWGTYSIDINVDSSLAGQILQFGFASTATNYNNSGMQYDNVNFSPVPEPSALVMGGLGVGLLALRRRKQ